MISFSANKLLIRFVKRKKEKRNEKRKTQRKKKKRSRRNLFNMTREELILDCRYYNGEKEPPEGIDNLMWGYEEA